MNLYFLSLIEPEKKREKCISNSYKISRNDHIYLRFQSQNESEESFNVALDQVQLRFPFLGGGDIVIFGGLCFGWVNGTTALNTQEINILDCEILKNKIHALPLRKDRLIFTYKEEGGNVDVEVGYFFSKVKLRKTRYNVFFFLDDREEDMGEKRFLKLETRIRNSCSFFYERRYRYHQQDEFIVSRKKILYLIF
jgi:hypothetical protein